MILKQLENFFPRLEFLIPEIRKFKFLNQDEWNKEYGANCSWPGLRTKKTPRNRSP